MRTIHDLSENFSDGLLFPKGTSAERGNPEAGYFRYNTETKGIEVYDGTSWSSMDNTPSYVTDGLVLNLDAGNLNSYDGSGTTWTDLSQVGNNLTINGATYDSNRFFSFDGSNDYIEALSDSSTYETSNFTVGGWFYKSNWSVSSSNILVMNANTIPGTSNSGGWQLYLSAAQSSLVADIFDGANLGTPSARVTYALSNISSGWHQIFMTYDNGTSTLKLYLDVNLLGSDTGTLAYGAEQNLLIGKWSLGNNYYFSGDLAITQVYDKALSSDEVTQNFNATKTRFGL